MRLLIRIIRFVLSPLLQMKSPTNRLESRHNFVHDPIRGSVICPALNVSTSMISVEIVYLKIGFFIARGYHIGVEVIQQ